MGARARRRARIAMLRRALRGLLLLLLPLLASAHQGGTTGYAQIEVDRSMVRYTLTLSQIPSSPLANAMHFGEPGVVPDYQPLVTAISEHLHFKSAGRDCAAGPGRLLPNNGASVSVSASVDFVCPGPIATLAVRDDLFDVTGTDLHTLAKVSSPAGTQQFAFATETRAAEFRIMEAQASSAGAASFLTLGIEHILTGYDHLLFLLALLLRAEGWVQVLKVITAFTLAHSVTLALAVLGLVTLPGALVEATIAASIAYVAAENLLAKTALSRRWMVSFTFGLVHGFGFSSVLREIGLPKENLALALFNFNLGVELGQAAAVAVVLPMLTWAAKRAWHERAMRAVSAVVCAIGVGLFVSRIAFS
ncbi:MAG: HupE/UreJ family protein [Gammaproteobacteria bacterium]|nr:HupE/UreJ family protein [Gammaproteobacteria bacterium]